SGAVSVQCLEQEGRDALDHPYPLFADLNYGSPKPPTYIYPAILWTKVFGHAIASYRAFSGFITVLTIGGIFWLTLCLFDIRAAAWASLLASVSPTVFQFSRVALEAGLAPLFLVWGMLCYVAADRRVAGVGAGTLFAFAMYSYPPARLFVPLFVVVLISIRWIQGQRNIGLMAGTLVALVIVSIPLVQGTLSGAYMGRFNKIGILSAEYLSAQGKAFTFGDIAGEFTRNYGKHLSPSYLFIKGDKNLVYSTGTFGLLSWVDTLALFVGVLVLFYWAYSKWIQKKSSPEHRSWSIVLLVSGVVLSVVPAALTWQDIPHSLRMILFWPFLAMINGVSLAVGCRYVRGLAPLSLILSGVFLSAYLSNYFRVYPERSYYMF
ncbi:MAG: glycosyltransferase family 39 protein, partial [Candidatus Omnitrophica bacterium]|nr:glycosyltransferase family 39 protein [Candidatus Omnitrophota bacterium]